MISERKLHANRMNAKKSTGPRTPEGKAMSCMNALKHGLRAEAVVLPGEDKEEFDALFLSVVEELQPETPFQAVIVERIAGTMWRLRRSAQFDASILCAAANRTGSDKSLDDLYRLQTPYTCEEAVDGHVFYKAADNLLNLRRYETSLERMLERMFDRLGKLKSARRERKAAQAPAYTEALAASLKGAEEKHVEVRCAAPSGRIDVPAAEGSGTPTPGSRSAATIRCRR